MFEVGDEVIALISSNAFWWSEPMIKGKSYIVLAKHNCKCGDSIDIGISITIPAAIARARCECGATGVTNICWMLNKYFVKPNRVKYTVKEVEIVPEIRELETCEN